MNSRVLILLALCGFLTLSSCRTSETPPGSAGPRRANADTSIKDVRVVLAEEGRLAQTIMVTGALAAQDQVTASVKVAGRVESVDVDFGSKVAKGQVIARLDPRDFRLRV